MTLLTSTHICIFSSLFNYDSFSLCVCVGWFLSFVLAFVNLTQARVIGEKKNLDSENASLRFACRRLSFHGQCHLVAGGPRLYMKTG